VELHLRWELTVNQTLAPQQAHSFAQAHHPSQLQLSFTFGVMICTATLQHGIQLTNTSFSIGDNHQQPTVSIGSMTWTWIEHTHPIATWEIILVVALLTQFSKLYKEITSKLIGLWHAVIVQHLAQPIHRLQVFKMQPNHALKQWQLIQIM
jgi:hypothetical protein